jgi:signal transduction histidine kinase/CheY-like chemotaxis protein
MSLHDYLAKGDFSDFSGLLKLWTAKLSQVAIFKIEHATYIPLIATDAYKETCLSIEPAKYPRILTPVELQDKNTEHLNTSLVPLSSHNQLVGAVLLGYESITLNVQGIEQTELFHLTSLVVFGHIQRNICTDLFIANMSHDIRTPLNGIIGYIQVLAKTVLNTDQETYIASLRQCSLQLMQIINDILDFFKLSAGKVSQEEHIFSPQEIVDIVTGTLGYALKKKNQQLTCFIDPKLPSLLVTDRTKLIQIAMNLLANAHKFTGVDGFILFNLLSVPSTNSKHVKVAIQVKDTGSGIAPENLQNIFRAFEQERTSQSGTGLGLAICSKLSKLLGGSINVQSELGKGSTFTAQIATKPYRTHIQEQKEGIAQLHNKTILLVEDNVLTRITVVKQLLKEKIIPVPCSSLLELQCLLETEDESESHHFDGALVGTNNTSTIIECLRTHMPLLPLLILGKPSVEFSEYATLDKPFDQFQLCIKLQQVLNCAETIPLQNIHISSPTTPQQHFQKDIRILIAEDVSYNAILLKAMLVSLGYTNITMAENGQEVLDLLEQSNTTGESFEILLLDLRMPIKSGFDVIDEHHKRKWKLPKIIVITASIMDRDREKCRSKGVQWFLHKPLELQQLSDVMLHASHRIRQELS